MSTTSLNWVLLLLYWLYELELTCLLFTSNQGLKSHPHLRYGKFVPFNPLCVLRIEGFWTSSSSCIAQTTARLSLHQETGVMNLTLSLAMKLVGTSCKQQRSYFTRGKGKSVCCIFRHTNSSHIFRDLTNISPHLKNTV